MDRNGSLLGWSSFLTSLKKRFGSSVYENSLERIAKLIQTGRVSKFHSDFEDLMDHIVGSMTMFLNFFIWGLKPKIRRELLINPPTSLTEAMVKAQLYEKRNDDLRGTLQREAVRNITTATPRLVGTYPSPGEHLKPHP